MEKHSFIIDNGDQDKFADGFYDGSPKCYDYEADISTPYPWCCPWLWNNFEDWYNGEKSFYEMGLDFAKKHFRDIEKDFS